VNTALLRFRSKSERQFRESGCALGAIWTAPALPVDTHVPAVSHAADLSRENIEHPAVTITLPAIIHTTAFIMPPSRFVDQSGLKLTKSPISNSRRI
jgi:hypothetical protein